MVLGNSCYTGEFFVVDQNCSHPVLHASGADVVLGKPYLKQIYRRAAQIWQLKSTVGGFLIGVFLFVAICAGVLAFEERDDGDQYGKKLKDGF